MNVGGKFELLDESSLQNSGLLNLANGGDFAAGSGFFMSLSDLSLSDFSAATIFSLPASALFGSGD